MLPGETIESGASSSCEDCGITVVLDVYHSGGGYYIGTYCNCGPYSRESSYYLTREQAEFELENGIWESR